MAALAANTQGWGLAGGSFPNSLRVSVCHAILAELARRLCCALSALPMREWLCTLTLEPCGPQ
jgi:hypothetical protein